MSRCVWSPVQSAVDMPASAQVTMGFNMARIREASGNLTAAASEYKVPGSEKGIEVEGVGCCSKRFAPHQGGGWWQEGGWQHQWIAEADTLGCLNAHAIVPPQKQHRTHDIPMSAA